MFMNTVLHFADEKIMISAACCNQCLGRTTSVSVSRNTRNINLRYYVFIDKLQYISIAEILL